MQCIDVRTRSAAFFFFSLSGCLVAHTRREGGLRTWQGVDNVHAEGRSASSTHMNTHLKRWRAGEEAFQQGDQT
jgi:hypothetical protein